jgi:3-oxoadipate CoA-transferase, alpha subunit
VIYRKTARNFGPVMATAAHTTVVQVSEIVRPGDLDPEAVITPGIFVDRVVKIAGASPMAAIGAAG